MPNLLELSMSLPVVVIVGRPNVGKSTLFNRIIGRGTAIVEDIAGVTRDRNLQTVEWEGRRFIVVDTGGFYSEADTDIGRQVREQALFAIGEADIIVHLMDAESGLLPDDIELDKLIRESGKTSLKIVNKIDGPKKEPKLYDFFTLGGDIQPLSAKTGYGFEDFMERLLKLLPKGLEPSEEALPRVSVIGRPNVGKSTLINTLIGKKRLIVSPIPGTTRDSIDTICTYYGKKYLFIDTAGIRKKARAYPIERFAMLRTFKSIERSDVCLIVLDSTEGVVAEDQKIAGEVLRLQKGAVFVLNKWDLVSEPEKSYKILIEDIKRKIWFFEHAPVLTISAIERTRVTKLFPLIDKVISERKKRVPTSELNELLRSIPPIYSGGSKIRLDYIVQKDIEPPCFLVFTKKPDALRPEHLRYIERVIRERFSFSGTPIKILKRQK